MQDIHRIKIIELLGESTCIDIEAAYISVDSRGGIAMSGCVGAGNIFTSTAVILVLYILLVIVLRTF